MKLSELNWNTTDVMDTDTLQAVNLPTGERITVLHRLTGFGGGDVFDTESGYRDAEGKFWIASGDMDVRLLPDVTTVEEAIAWIKANANSCVGE